MGLLDLIFQKKTPFNQSMEFIQARNFRGFKRYKISNYDYPEAQENIKKIRAVNPKMDFNGCMIRLDLITCSTNTDALAVFLADLRIGTIFFGENNFKELKNAFYNNKISAACVRPDDLGELNIFIQIDEE